MMFSTPNDWSSSTFTVYYGQIEDAWSKPEGWQNVAFILLWSWRTIYSTAPHTMGSSFVSSAQELSCLHHSELLYWTPGAPYPVRCSCSRAQVMRVYDSDIRALTATRWLTMLTTVALFCLYLRPQLSRCSTDGCAILWLMLLKPQGLHFPYLEHLEHCILMF